MPFTPTHDLDRLASAAEPHHVGALDLLEGVRSLTAWGTAYRYPGPDDVAEPLPAESEIENVLSVVDALAAVLGGKVEK